MKKLERGFYQREDVVLISRELLGKKLYTHIPHEGITAGIIVETEAYEGITDKASHAYNKKYTNRTKTMYGPGGIAYVYLCYGIHRLFNVITNVAGIPHAVLVRAIEPVDGIETMMHRRGRKHLEPSLTSGPGSLTMALGIEMRHNGLKLSGSEIWIADEGYAVPQENIIASPRVGVSYAGYDALLPYRFRMKDNPFTSPAR